MLYLHMARPVPSLHRHYVNCFMHQTRQYAHVWIFYSRYKVSFEEKVSDELLRIAFSLMLVLTID